MLFKDNGACLVEYRDERLTLRIISQLQGSTAVPGWKTVPQKKVNALCQDYWDVVDDAVRSGAFNDSKASALSALFPKLMTKGAQIRETLMDLPMTKALWTLAKNSATLLLVVPDSLLHVPWEALFNPYDGCKSFLGDFTVIARYPENPDGETREPRMENKFRRERIVCVDNLLRKVIEAQLVQDGENPVYPNNQCELARYVEDTRLTHWICEHESKGLRFDTDVFFTAADASVHRFPTGSVLVLTSCKTGASAPDVPSIAARICCSSDCTVIAPSSLVAITAGVQFARAINLAISGSGGPLSVAQYWRRLGEARAAHMRDPANPAAPEAWASLWYGIYGNVDRSLGG